MFDQLIPLLVALALGALVILAGLALMKVAQGLRGKAGNPTVQSVLDSLEKYIYMAILAGEKTVSDAETQADASLQGTDKKAVADSMYDLLPDYLLVDGIPLPSGLIKSFVPRDVFETRVKDAYDAAHAFIMKNKAWLDSQVVLIAPAPSDKQVG